MRPGRRLRLAAAGAFIAGALAGCRDEAPAAPTVSGARALELVGAQVAFGPRIPGSDGHRRMAEWMDSLLRARADTVVVQEWSHVTVGGDTLPLRNFIARFNPGAEERILLLAHWDTRPFADAAGSADTTAPVTGANDGGSGTAVLLALAEVLDSAPPPVGVDLLFVDGEDYGEFDEARRDVLLGSKYYAANRLPGRDPVFAVLLDMVGDRDPKFHHEGNSVVAAPDVVELVWETARELGHGDVFIPQVRHTLVDDHIPLLEAGIRAIDVVDFDYGLNNAYWHSTEDTMDKLSPRSLEIVGNVMLGVIWGAGGGG